MIGSGFFYSRIILQERIAHMDEQLLGSASLILNSTLVDSDGISFEEAEEIVADLMGGDNIGLVLVLEHRDGRILFRNRQAQRIGLEWTKSLGSGPDFIEVTGNSMRVASVSSADAPVILHIGNLVNKAVLRADLFSEFKVWVFLVIFVLSLILSFFLASVLLRPLRELSEFLSFSAEKLNKAGSSGIGSLLPKALSKRRYGRFLKHEDEFHGLVSSVSNFLAKVNKTLDSYGGHLASLAHEINTPLALIRNQAQALTGCESERQKAKYIVGEVDRLSCFLKSYLEWAESSSSKDSPSVHAIPLSSTVRIFCDKIASIANGRIKVELGGDSKIFADPSDFEHLMLNIVTNALRYSPVDQPVLVRVSGTELYVDDFGSGIPEDVLENLGRPFNRGKSAGLRSEQRGNGLGLAWVDLVTRKYNWKLEIKGRSPGTTVSISMK
jgi:signal transduction histidine kinase